MDEKSIENGLEGQKFLVVCLFWGGCHHPNVASKNFLKILAIICPIKVSFFQDDKFSVLLSTEESLRTLVGLIGDIKSLSPQLELVESQAVYSVEEPVLESEETAEPEEEIKEVEAEKVSDDAEEKEVVEEKVKESPAEESSEPAVQETDVAEPSASPEPQIDHTDTTETSDVNEGVAAEETPVEAAAKIVDDVPEAVEPETVEPETVEPETVEPETVEPELVEPSTECAEEAAVDDGGCCPEPTPEVTESDVPVAEPEPLEAASEPQPDDNQQYEIVDTPQAESLVASSMSGSSFVNVPSCEEVDSYQDISTSSPDTNPSSPNRSHSSTPTGIQEDELEEADDELEPELDRTQTSETEAGDTLQETSDIQPETEEVAPVAQEEVVEAQPEPVETTQESVDATEDAAEPSAPEESPVEEETREPQVEVETEKANEEVVGEEAAAQKPGVVGEQSLDADQEPATEEEAPPATTTDPTESKTPADPPAPSAETEQQPPEPTTPVKPGFVFTVNPSIVPGSIIRTPERTASRPQASLYEETVVGTAEI